MGDIYDGLLGSVAKMLYPVLVPTIKDILSSVALAAIANWTDYEGNMDF
ncbi:MULTISPECIES: hypothetical protein [unclassified Nostoc]|nr:hypothetical protein [Nostoc sp. ChiQUE02]